MVKKPNMQIEKKLILCSILAVAIGIATIVPLAYLMSPARAQTDTNDQPQFNFDMPYAYVRNVWDNSTLTQDTYGWAFAFTFKTSPTFELSNDSVVYYYETYRAELTSEKGSIANISLKAWTTSDTFVSNTNKSVSVSTTYTSENITDASTSNDFILYLDQSWYNFTYGDTEGRAGAYNGTATNYRNGFGGNWNLSSDAPESLTLTIYRENWIIRTANSTDIHTANPEAIQTIQLQRYGNGFIYNTAIPQDEMDKINPLFPGLKIK